MGQYHKTYNLTKREFIHPHHIDNGLKLLEQCGPGNKATTSDALFLLLANSNGRGSGDAPRHKLIGYWAGDRVIVQGDYAQEGDKAFIPEEELEQFKNISTQVLEMLEVVFGEGKD